MSNGYKFKCESCDHEYVSQDNPAKCKCGKENKSIDTI